MAFRMDGGASVLLFVVSSTSITIASALCCGKLNTFCSSRIRDGVVDGVAWANNGDNNSGSSDGAEWMAVDLIDMASVYKVDVFVVETIEIMS